MKFRELWEMTDKTPGELLRGVVGLRNRLAPERKG